MTKSSTKYFSGLAYFHFFFPYQFEASLVRQYKEKNDVVKNMEKSVVTTITCTLKMYA